MSLHKTPTKVTVEFASGSPVVFQATGTTKHVVELHAYRADRDDGTSSIGDERYTGVLYR